MRNAREEARTKGYGGTKGAKGKWSLRLRKGSKLVNKALEGGKALLDKRNLEHRNWWKKARTQFGPSEGCTRASSGRLTRLLRAASVPQGIPLPQSLLTILNLTPWLCEET